MGDLVGFRYAVPRRDRSDDEWAISSRRDKKSQSFVPLVLVLELYGQLREPHPFLAACTAHHISEDDKHIAGNLWQGNRRCGTLVGPGLPTKSAGTRPGSRRLLLQVHGAFMSVSKLLTVRGLKTHRTSELSNGCALEVDDLRPDGWSCV